MTSLAHTVCAQGLLSNFDERRSRHVRPSAIVQVFQICKGLHLLQVSTLACSARNSKCSRASCTIRRSTNSKTRAQCRNASTTFSSLAAHWATSMASTRAFARFGKISQQIFESSGAFSVNQMRMTHQAKSHKLPPLSLLAQHACHRETIDFELISCRDVPVRHFSDDLLLFVRSRPFVRRCVSDLFGKEPGVEGCSAFRSPRILLLSASLFPLEHL